MNYGEVLSLSECRQVHYKHEKCSGCQCPEKVIEYRESLEREFGDDEEIRRKEKEVADKIKKFKERNAKV